MAYAALPSSPADQGFGIVFDADAELSDPLPNKFYDATLPADYTLPSITTASSASHASPYHAERDDAMPTVLDAAYTMPNPAALEALRWQLNDHSHLTQAAPRATPALQPKRDIVGPLKIPSSAHNQFPINDPLGDVLDWLGRSELGKDDRFVPPDIKHCSEDDLDRLMDPDAPLNGDARELFADISSAEKGGQARAQAPRARAPKLAKPQLEASRSCPQLALACPLISNAPARRDLVAEEEEEWTTRQQRTGTVGRLVVYADGESPQEDVLLRGGFDHHLVVAAVRDNGPAARSGVRAGDRLVSIDGKKDFKGMSADAVRDRLRAPSMLVFLGFVGKLQAEVRLTCTDRVCGLSMRHQVAKGYMDAPVQVCEERVFNAGIASLFLAIDDEADKLKFKDAANVLPKEDSINANIPMFELQRGEAHGLVRSALQNQAAKNRNDNCNAPRGALSRNLSGFGFTVGDSSAALATRPLETLVKPGGDRGQVDDDLLKQHAPSPTRIPQLTRPQQAPQDQDPLQFDDLQQYHQKLHEHLQQLQVQQIASSPRVQNPKDSFAERQV